MVQFRATGCAVLRPSCVCVTAAMSALSLFLLRTCSQCVSVRGDKQADWQPQQWPQFASRAVLVVDKVAMKQVFLKVLRYSPVKTVPPLLNINPCIMWGMDKGSVSGHRSTNTSLIPPQRPARTLKSALQHLSTSRFNYYRYHHWNYQITGGWVSEACSMHEKNSIYMQNLIWKISGMGQLERPRRRRQNEIVTWPVEIGVNRNTIEWEPFVNTVLNNHLHKRGTFLEEMINCPFLKKLCSATSVCCYITTQLTVRWRHAVTPTPSDNRQGCCMNICRAMQIFLSSRPPPTTWPGDWRHRS
jgi:hypothetical protein